jgi:methylenetetrahydrofolate--tRNA-(uracil-5-)-methyltransferase
MSKRLKVIGGGLAGCEAAWRAAALGVETELYEMKPLKYSPAHKSQNLAELVCSNSFRANGPENAVGVLKEELRTLGSVIIGSADATRVPAGRALAADRDLFSALVTKKIEGNGSIKLIRGEIAELDLSDKTPVLVAAGPLVSEPLAGFLKKITGLDSLSFYDALAPIVTDESVDKDRMFLADRYSDKQGDYLNSPMTRAEFNRFYDALRDADMLEAREFERQKFFEGCLPIEVMALRGPRTLTYGPMKPVGLKDPRTGEKPFAVVQLRKENRAGTLWNIVGFQTRLTRPAQDKVLRLIPGLEKAEFARWGAIHRNTFLNAPKALDEFQRLSAHPHIFIGGQLSGVEGYVESAAHGLLAGENAARALLGKDPVVPPADTALGALASHLRPFEGRGAFAPSNVNFGLFPRIPKEIPRKDHVSYRLNRARESLRGFMEGMAESMAG